MKAADRQSSMEHANALRSELVDLIRTVFFWGGISWISYCVVLAVRAIAGQSTDARVVVTLLINAIADVAPSRWGWAAGILGVTYGYFQRRKRLQEIVYYRILLAKFASNPGRDS